MSAIESSVYNYQCGGNVTLARKYTDDMITDFQQKKSDDGMTQMNKLLKLADDITINCASAIISSDTPSNFFENLLYNAGFMFTDILDMVWYDTRNTDP